MLPPSWAGLLADGIVPLYRLTFRALALLMSRAEMRLADEEVAVLRESIADAAPRIPHLG